MADGREEKEQQDQRSVAWMIERRVDGRAAWWTGGHSDHFDHDPMQGVRFARKTDAFWVARHRVQTPYELTEHIFIGEVHGCRTTGLCDNCGEVLAQPEAAQSATLRSDVRALLDAVVVMFENHTSEIANWKEWDAVSLAIHTLPEAQVKAVPLSSTASKEGQ